MRWLRRYSPSTAWATVCFAAVRLRWSALVENAVRVGGATQRRPPVRRPAGVRHGALHDGHDGSDPPAQRDASDNRHETRQAGIIVLADAFMNFHRKTITGIAARHHLPAMYGFQEYVDDGGLMSYVANLKDQFRRAGGYVARILKGAKPADLPIEQPTRFRASDQPQDRQGPRPDHFPVAAGAGGSGHRVKA